MYTESDLYDTDDKQLSQLELCMLKSMVHHCRDVDVENITTVFTS